MGNGCIGSLIGGLIGLAVGIGFSFLCASSESMVSAGEAGYGLESLTCLLFPFIFTIIGLVIGFGWGPPSNAQKPATLICDKCNHTNPKSSEWQHCTKCGNSLKNTASARIPIKLIISAIFAIGFIWVGGSIAFGALIVGVLGYVIYKFIKNNPTRGL